MFNGTKININGEEFVIPPISLGYLRSGGTEKLREHDSLVADGKTFDAMLLRGTIILDALKRNYPDFPENKLFDFLDLSNTGPIWLSVLGASGFSPGEVQAALTAINGISGPSTEASPPPTDGPIAK